MPNEATVSIKIPKELYDKAAEYIKGTSIQSVDEFVTELLKEEFPSKEEFTEEEEKIIKERLKRLGYIE